MIPSLSAVEVTALDINDMSEGQLVMFAAINDVTPEFRDYEDLADKKAIVAEEWKEIQKRIKDAKHVAKPNDHFLEEPAEMKITNGVYAPTTMADVRNATQDAVVEMDGEISSDDGIPTDQEKGWAALL
jgi:hypothetical protein